MGIRLLREGTGALGGRRLAVALALCGSCVAGCGGSPYRDLAPYQEKTPTSAPGHRSVGLSEEAGGLVKVPGRAPHHLTGDLPGTVTKVVTGYYRLPSVAEDASTARLTAVIAVETDAAPRGDVRLPDVYNDLIGRLSGGHTNDDLGHVSDMDPGPLGGVAECGYSPVRADEMICAWYDDETAGAASFPNLTTTAADDFLENREFSAVCRAFLALRQALEH
ncbi:hypothetical protein GCM10022221_26850 [Actinocorallia aurea]